MGFRVRVRVRAIIYRVVSQRPASSGSGKLPPPSRSASSPFVKTNVFVGVVVEKTSLLLWLWLWLLWLLRNGFFVVVVAVDVAVVVVVVVVEKTSLLWWWLLL